MPVTPTTNMGTFTGPYTGGQSWSQSSLRLKLPEFDGETDVEEWLLRVQHYFSFYCVPKWDRVKICSVQLKGIDAHWYDWLLKIRGVVSWNEFCQCIRMEFGPSQFTDHVIDLKLLRHEETVQEYTLQFQKLSKKVTGFPEKCLVSQYIGGLKDEVRYEVLVSNPVNLPAAMQVAKLHEAKLTAVRRSNRPTSNLNKGANVGSHFHSTHNEAHVKAYAQGTEGRANSGFKAQTNTISPSELLRRKNLGLCFLCDEKWTRGHRCKEKKLFMLVADEDEEDTEANETVPQTEDIGITSNNPQSLYEISLQALSGTLHQSTMKLRGTVKNKPVIILVDSGSTHSFINASFSERFQLPMTEGNIFDVVVANGEKLTSKGLCKNVIIECQGTRIITDLLPLPISGCHVVLGANWLSTLGDIMWNFQDLTMKFTIKGVEHQFQGMKHQNKQLNALELRDLRQKPQFL